jgi:hypothetical protein
MMSIKNRTCSKRIYSGSFLNSGHLCGRPAKVEFEGKTYCGIHDPIKAKKIDEIRKKAWEAKWEIDREERHRTELMKKILGGKTTKELEQMAKDAQ